MWKSPPYHYTLIYSGPVEEYVVDQGLAEDHGEFLKKSMLNFDDIVFRYKTHIFRDGVPLVSCRFIYTHREVVCGMERFNNKRFLE
jgi:hypothetical protein